MAIRAKVAATRHSLTTLRCPDRKLYIIAKITEKQLNYMYRPRNRKIFYSKKSCRGGFSPKTAETGVFWPNKRPRVEKVPSFLILIWGIIPELNFFIFFVFFLDLVRSLW